MNRQERVQWVLEHFLYVLIWSVVFVLPVFVFAEDNSVNWQEVFHFWKKILPFFGLFLLNNYLFVPFLLFRKRYWGYVFAVFAAILVAILPGHLLVSRMRPELPPQQTRVLSEAHRFPPPGDAATGERHPHPPSERHGEFMPLRMSPFLNDIFAAIWILGLNLAIRFLFRSNRFAQKMREMEKQSLQAELNYLKTQINPHFFMNTLNNIHALIDRDTEKAKETVIELSKIMRYVLYEADQPWVPLLREIQFLDNYVRLMRIRYTDGVDIQVSVPESIPEVKIPPLLLITLVENAFKHGVSYRRDSYIHTCLKIEEDRLYYRVDNRFFSHNEKTEGMGLENMQKRLFLLYDSDYVFDVTCEEGKYSVLLTIPIIHNP